MLSLSVMLRGLQIRRTTFCLVAQHLQIPFAGELKKSYTVAHIYIESSYVLCCEIFRRAYHMVLCNHCNKCNRWLHMSKWLYSLSFLLVFLLDTHLISQLSLSWIKNCKTGLVSGRPWAGVHHHNWQTRQMFWPLFEKSVTYIITIPLT